MPEYRAHHAEVAATIESYSVTHCCPDAIQSHPTATGESTLYENEIDRAGLTSNSLPLESSS
jgi:hypothetical protein